MKTSERFPSRWLPLLAAVEPDSATDPAALGRAIARWATLAAASHRAAAAHDAGEPLAVGGAEASR